MLLIFRRDPPADIVYQKPPGNRNAG